MREACSKFHDELEFHDLEQKLSDLIDSWRELID